MCQRLEKFAPDFDTLSSNYLHISTFRRLLLSVCQHEFDNRVSNSDVDQTTNDHQDTHADHNKQTNKKKMLGNIKFIGELGRLDLLNEAILHKCIRTLLEKGKHEKYSDMSDDLECLCKMMPCVGKKLDQNEAKKLMDQYFDRLEKLKSIQGKDALPVRIKFMIQDCIDLRKNNWEQRKIQQDQVPKKMTDLRPGSKTSEPTPTANPTLSPFLNKMYEQINSQPNMTLLNAINSFAKQPSQVKIKSAYSEFSYQEDLDDLPSSTSSSSSQNDLNKNPKDEIKPNFVPLSFASRPSQRIVQAEKTRSNSSSSISALSSSSSVAPSVSPPIQIDIQQSKFFDNQTTKAFTELNRLIANVNIGEVETTFNKQVDLFLDNYLQTNELNLNELKKFSNEKLTDFIKILIGLSLSKRSDSDRSRVSQMIVEIETKLGMNGLLKSSLKKILDNLNKLEQEHHCVKSNIGMYISRAMIDQLIEIRYLADLMKNGAYYPLFFIVMQQLIRLKTDSGLSLEHSQTWLKDLVEREQVCLIDMLPNNADKNGSRLAQVLDDRELHFLRPMLRYEETIFNKISIDNVQSNDLVMWINDNLSENLIGSNEFIRSLTNW